MTEFAGTSEAATLLSEHVMFPCGKLATNRLAKAPMEEMLGKAGGGLPNDAHLTLYRHWARGGWGLLITGNVAIDCTHLGTPFDITLPKIPYSSKEVRESFKAYARAAKGLDQIPPVKAPPLVVVQLVHAGRQSMRGAGRAPWKAALAPSAVAMTPSSSLGMVGKALDYVLWGTPAAMTKEEIGHLIAQFAAAAELCSETGFDGIELHASHGYQLAAFLSPRTNTRMDEYGQNGRGRARLLLEVVQAVRKRVPSDFIVGVKLNSCDYVRGGLTEDDALLNVQWLAESGAVDFVEISGGNYENAAFLTDNFDSDKERMKMSGTVPARRNTTSTIVPLAAPPSIRTMAREAFFQDFAKKARDSVDAASSKMVLILTGGLRTRKGMSDAIKQGRADLVGIGRPACVFPALPHTILDESVPDEDVRSSPRKYKVKGSGFAAWIPLQLAAPGWGTIWHDGMIAYLARDQAPDINANALRVLVGIFLPSLVKFANAVTSFVARLLGLLLPQTL
ncbi:hypothetical protein CBS101457_003354 [Exobasidium rhododendri]|nr:hypothetical protein CBS101457_003354 [Exobasidium rhododendri]